MRDDIKKALVKFENTHHSAVQADTELGNMNLDGDRYFRVERTSKQYWQDFYAARKELYDLLEKIN